MSEYKNFTYRDLGDDYVVCEDVHLPSGSVCTIYISPTSVYVLSSGRSAPAKRYQEIQNLLGAVRVRLYLLPFGDSAYGLYDDLTDTLTSELDDEQLTADINAWLSSGRVIYSRSSIDRMVSCLKNADIHGRGYCVEDNGEIFLLRHGTLHKASPVPSELQYYLTLFGGILGLHRFTLGKFFSGVCYFLTAGFFLVGWLLDLIQLLIGGQKDSKKRYLLPLANRKWKLLVLPFGLAFGFLLFQGYLKVSELFGSAFQKEMVQQVTGTDLRALERLLNILAEYFPR